jgi:4-diphosphocytidyl-2-C-methyl-D-erythritol kinase
MSTPITVRAPAKLTRSLRVVGTRPDGYHLIEAEMVSLEWGDSLLIDPDGEGLIIEDETPWSGDPRLSVSPVSVGADNLVSRALSLLGRRAGVRLIKRIPPGAGLGGGSSDAAAVMRWAGVDPDRTGLDLAAGLGADVPFCLVGGRARVTGIGEAVAPLAPLALDLTLLLVPIASSTPAVYAAWDRLQPGPGPVNDLERPALAVQPGLARWRDAWGEATGREPVLAGSGSTWFVEQARPDLAGPFPNPDAAGPPGWVLVTRSDRT